MLQANFMRKNKIILKSLVVAVLYFVTANIYFFEGVHDSTTESLAGQFIEKFFTLPSIIIFGVGFRYGLAMMFLSAILMFLIIWSITLGLTYALYWITSKIYKNKTNA